MTKQNDVLAQGATAQPLIKGAVYHLKDYGPAEYVGIDVYGGETTHQFKIGRTNRFLRPDMLTEQLATASRTPAEGETQVGVSQWADETFGPASSNARVAARANEEMAELLRALTADDNHEKAAEEVADVVIVLYRLMTRLGADMATEINRKMAINRARKWNLTADGHGYHVRDRHPLTSTVGAPE